MFFFEKRQQFNARAGQKKRHVFFGNARPKSNACAHLKQRKKTIVVLITCHIIIESFLLYR